MNPYLRNGLAILGGLIVGGMVNGGIIALSPKIIAPPAGLDVNDMNSLETFMPLMSPKHFIMPFLAHAIGTLAGAYLTARLVTKAPAFYAFIIGAVFLLGGAYMAYKLPSPLWFDLLDVIVAYIPMAMIGQLLARKKRSDEQF